MDLLFCMPGYDARAWLDAFARWLPEARARVWQPGDHAVADYAAVWKPPAEALRARAGLRAVFNLGAGVDALLDMIRREPDALAQSVPLIRLEDAGMADQMVEYVLYAALRYMRRFDEYERLRAAGRWAPLAAPRPKDFPVAVLGLGQLGSAVSRSLAHAGFPVRGWSRTPRQI
ncbi:MAG TPA: NAD(P)-dependent oxidoreductase, partial [Pararobbsia sp.]|nr:NAD(P)-dependent oxidoreductase [Pararobbsia sp.]